MPYSTIVIFFFTWNPFPGDDVNHLAMLLFSYRMNEFAYIEL